MQTLSSIPKPEYYGDLMLLANDLLEVNRIKVFEFGTFHRDMMKLVLTNRYTGVMLPVGHLKTTLVSTCYAIWRLLRERNYEICLVSATLNQSIKMLAQVQYLIENTPWLKHLAPDDRSYTWSKTQLNTSNGNMMYVRAFNPSARGIQPNEIIYDDILREENVSMDQIKDTFWHVFFPRGQTKQCKHTVVGTPVSTDDLLHELKSKAEKDGNWAFITYPAVITDEKGNMKPLWPERFTMDELNEIKRNMGQYRFSQEYLCSPSTGGEGFFRQDFVLNCSDDNLGFAYNTEGVVTIGADFAMSDAPTGDYNVFTVVDCVKGEYKRKMMQGREPVEVTVVDPVIIKHIERYRGSVGQVRKLKQLVDTYRPQKVIADVSSFGSRFVQELREQGVAVDGQDFWRANRNAMLVNLRRIMETEDVFSKPPRLVIPTSEKDGTFTTTKALIRELSGFIETKTPSGMKTVASILGHDDMVMSLALAVKDIGFQRKTPTKLIYSAKPYDLGINI